MTPACELFRLSTGSRVAAACKAGADSAYSGILNMVGLDLRPEIENLPRQRLAAGVDANDLMEAALESMAEWEAVRDAVEAGWQQADAGDFVRTSPESILRRANPAG